MGALKQYYHEYLSSEDFDLMTEEEIDAVNWDYYQQHLEDNKLEQYLLEKEAMETHYSI